MKVAYILTINPEPWAVGKAFAMGGKRAGISPNRKLVAYQEAVKEELKESYSPPLLTGPVGLRFLFSRKIEKLSYGNTVGHAGYSDATNLQKGLEDAMQGILYKNDSQVVDVQSVIVQQSIDAMPGIVVEVDDEPDINPYLQAMLFYTTEYANKLLATHSVPEGTVPVLNPNKW